MKNKTYRVLGRNGRVTIPYKIRNEHEMCPNDIISFEDKDDWIIVKREKVCDGCQQVTIGIDKPPKLRPMKVVEEKSLIELIDTLSPKEQKAIFAHLSLKPLDVAGSGARI